MTKPFSSTEEKIFWIEDIIRKYQEGTASEQEIADFRSLLSDDEEARRIYHESNQLTFLLESIETTSAPQKTIPFQAITRWTAGIAAALALGIWIIFHQPATQDQPSSDSPPWLATLSSSHKAVWEDPVETGTQFQKEHLSLQSGIAELTFENEARIVLEGPCELKIIDANTVELTSGKLWSHCPPSAHGFEVLTPGENRVVDLGTEFGVEVDSKGQVDVHVFDGEVELHQDDQERWSLEAGAAMKLTPGEDPFASEADFDRFTDEAKLQQERWQDHREAMLARDDLHLYYDFTAPSFLDDTLKNHVATIGNGRITGAVRVNGRIPGKSALLFEKSYDAITLDLRELSAGKGLTIGMWIKPTSFAKSSMALLNSDGFEPGNIHFQIHDDGRLMSALAGEARYSSPRNTIKTDLWQFVTVSWDFETHSARLFVNGQALESARSEFANATEDPAPYLGICHIGKWDKPTYGHQRNFVGRVGEVMIFSTALEESEVELLYESGRP
jgi:hypothetical protein